YRYGFNGKENDNEVKGEGNEQDYGMRIYDPRLGRFLSVDPLTEKYPWYTPYQFAGNKPIEFIDIDGMEEGAPDRWAERDLRDLTSGKIDEKGLEERFKVRAGVSRFFTLHILPKLVIVAIAIAQPEAGIPLLISDITGVPVTPSPQAVTGTVLSDVTTLEN